MFNNDHDPASLPQGHPSGDTIRAPSRTPIVLSAGIVFLIALFAAASWESWIPLREVSVTRVLAQRPLTDSGQQSSSSGQTAFQAAGWIEADPFVTYASALVYGTLSTVSVRDGQQVSKGQELARLDDANYRLQQEQAAAAVAEAEAQVLSSSKRIHTAEANLATQEKSVAVAKARVEQQRDATERFQRAAEAVSALSRRQAELALATAEAEHAAASTQLNVYIAQVEETRAQHDIYHARLKTAQAQLAKAQLDLERCIIRSPMDGVIQNLLAVPGGNITFNSDNKHSACIATLFDPAQLQVRVDVALADSGGLFEGQKTRITCSALPGTTFEGSVTRLLGSADLSRNTLQAKVRIHNPHSLLRPDMLVKVAFLGAEEKHNSQLRTENSGPLLCYLPWDIVGQDNSSTSLWLVDEENRLVQRQVTLAQRHNNYVAVSDGLRPGEWVVINPAADMHNGERVRVTEVRDE